MYYNRKKNQENTTEIHIVVLLSKEGAGKDLKGALRRLLGLVANFLHLNGGYSNVICDHSLVCLSIICIISNNIHKIVQNTFKKIF